MLGFSNFSAQGIDFGLRGKDAGLVLGLGSGIGIRGVKG